MKPPIVAHLPARTTVLEGAKAKIRVSKALSCGMLGHQPSK